MKKWRFSYNNHKQAVCYRMAAPTTPFVLIRYFMLFTLRLYWIMLVKW